MMFHCSTDLVDVDDGRTEPSISLTLWKKDTNGNLFDHKNIISFALLAF